MDGYEASERIKADDRTSKIPLVAITASALRQDEENILKICDGYIRKPIAKKDLIDELIRFLPHQLHETIQADEIEEEHPIIINGLVLEKLDRLKSFTQMGSYEKLEETLLEIESQYSEIKPLGDKIRQLAYDFNADGIIEYIDSMFKKKW